MERKPPTLAKSFEVDSGRVADDRHGTHKGEISAVKGREIRGIETGRDARKSEMGEKSERGREESCEIDLIDEFLDT
ncbi:hypothetical protein DM860_002807 [Cuscuta australis]|uniref:Uncharacterized protein n=1 Tax=Cuscuta australis TaxID=267555 RepID=A0A328D192_9ASTE|nr:hypothetical protein DM860_002807 [Cuscuta australis]